MERDILGEQTKSGGQGRKGTANHPAIRLQGLVGNRATAQVLARETASNDDTYKSDSDVTFLTIELESQGKLKGNTTIKDKQGQIEANDFEFEASSPGEYETGAPTGKRQYAPVTFTKKTDSTTPRIMQALTSNEVITSLRAVSYASGDTGPYMVIDFVGGRFLKLKSSKGRDSVAFVFDSYTMRSGDQETQDAYKSRT